MNSLLGKCVGRLLLDYFVAFPFFTCHYCLEIVISEKTKHIWASFCSSGYRWGFHILCKVYIRNRWCNFLNTLWTVVCCIITYTACYQVNYLLTSTYIHSARRYENTVSTVCTQKTCKSSLNVYILNWDQLWRQQESKRGFAPIGGERQKGRGEKVMTIFRKILSDAIPICSFWLKEQ